VLAALADVVEAGVPVLWIAGNHDCWGGEIESQDGTHSWSTETGYGRWKTGAIACFAQSSAIGSRSERCDCFIPT
jgi:hypothetical protein